MQGVNGSKVCVRFEGFELDLRAGELRPVDGQNGGKAIRLAEQPFLILTMLVERAGQVVTREEIRKRLWPNPKGNSLCVLDNDGLPCGMPVPWAG